MPYTVAAVGGWVWAGGFFAGGVFTGIAVVLMLLRVQSW